MYARTSFHLLSDGFCEVEVTAEGAACSVVDVCEELDVREDVDDIDAGEVMFTA